MKFACQVTYRLSLCSLTSNNTLCREHTSTLAVMTETFKNHGWSHDELERVNNSTRGILMCQLHQPAGTRVCAELFPVSHLPLWRLSVRAIHTVNLETTWKFGPYVNALSSFQKTWKHVTILAQRANRRAENEHVCKLNVSTKVNMAEGGTQTQQTACLGLWLHLLQCC